MVILQIRSQTKECSRLLSGEDSWVVAVRFKYFQFTATLKVFSASVAVQVSCFTVANSRGCRCLDLDTGSDEPPRMTSWHSSWHPATVMISDSSGNQIQIFHNFQFSRPARSGDEVELPAHLLRPGHAVDHDVGQTVPPPPPASEAAAVESDAVKPVQRLLRILALNTRKLDQQNYKQTYFTSLQQTV